MTISDEEMSDMIAWAVDQTPPMYKERLQNVAFILEDDPSEEQRRRLQLADDQTLFGLYEGIPLTARAGINKVLPDKITLFKNPLLSISRTKQDLQKNVRHTVWHEIAHYFGLDHKRIYELDSK